MSVPPCNRLSNKYFLSLNANSRQDYSLQTDFRLPSPPHQPFISVLQCPFVGGGNSRVDGVVAGGEGLEVADVLEHFCTHTRARLNSVIESPIPHTKNGLATPVCRQRTMHARQYRLLWVLMHNIARLVPHYSGHPHALSPRRDRPSRCNHFTFLCVCPI